MQLPVVMEYDHHGRISKSEEYMPSTGTTLGAITLPYAFPDPERELRRRVEDWKRTLDRDAEGRYEVGMDYYLNIYLDEEPAPPIRRGGRAHPGRPPGGPGGHRPAPPRPNLPHMRYRYVQP